MKTPTRIKIILVIILLIIAVQARGDAVAHPSSVKRSWKSGATTVTYSDDGTLMVSGMGAMDDYVLLAGPLGYNVAPWGKAELGDVTALVIEEGVTYIGNCAFSGINLTSVTIPNSVTGIGDAAFHSRAMTSVTIPNSVAYMGEGAFAHCSNLTSVTIHGSIGRGAFFACTSLKSVTIGDGVTSIGYLAFGRCENLTSMTIPGSVTNIGTRAFSECTNLASIIIEEGVTVIGYCAFEGCTSLRSITIPKSVTYFGNEAFAGCTSLTSVIIQNPKPLEEVLFSMFSDIYRNACLYVPSGSVEAYRNADMWKYFDCINEIPEEKQDSRLNPWLVRGILTVVILSVIVAVFILTTKLRKSPVHSS